MSMPKPLKLFLLSIRDLIASAGPVVFLVIALLVAAYWWLQPQPPQRVTLATGPAGSAYAEFGKRYAQALATSGIQVELRPSDGSSDNLQMLRNGDVDVAFVRGGSADVVADEEAGLRSLGSLFYEPLWVFYRSDTARRIDRKTGTLSSLAQLQGLRVNVDKLGSGVPEIMDKMFRANHLDPAQMQLSHLEQKSASEALQAGLLDVIVLASAPQSPQVQHLLRTPGIALLDFGQSDAYSRRFAFLSAVSLPRGVVDLAKDLPPADVSMLAATTSLLSREQTHPALQQLFAQSAQTLHGEAGWFNHARDFPNTRTSELPVSPEGDRAINGTPPFWQRYLPFWASNLVERMWLVLGGLVVLMLPLSRVVPPLYQFRVRSRVFRWYARLREVETRLEGGTDAQDKLLKELDDLDRRVNKVAVPLSYADELYALRRNIATVRRRVEAMRSPAAKPVST
ncbi:MULTISPECIES: TAXI family TRAP transporter solute-binding subunit [unclassified Variovorax]|uniref:TAXI family TRAP transporter solute-binding subunit n=1 Tax=unclassified Variovorax TaxID=663243 RepID=UPI0025782B35|nr:MULTISPECIES: TAXI family TRAP transporter solute-binding subunit [unclassified Variovorax]MDM0087334.1 TAXI family TRAP transporter solute-binding subunit [Variovorax sp. J22G40]MDM0144409.1 TAXI family TRAP transporter solute-binding subunit [Variovorax sp. J2P1-31]